MSRPEDIAALLGQFFTADDLRSGFADGGHIEVRYVPPPPESLCATCTSPITLTAGEWITDSGSTLCRFGDPHRPMGGA